MVAAHSRSSRHSHRHLSPSSPPSVLRPQASGLYYNRGKAYGYLGKSAEATMSYELAVQVARGKNPHIYALAATSLKA